MSKRKFFAGALSILTLVAACQPQETTIEAGRMGEVAYLAPEGEPNNVIFLFSDTTGWNTDLDEVAQGTAVPRCRINTSGRGRFHLRAHVGSERLVALVVVWGSTGAGAEIRSWHGWRRVGHCVPKFRPDRTLRSAVAGHLCPVSRWR